MNGETLGYCRQTSVKLELPFTGCVGKHRYKPFTGMVALQIHARIQKHSAVSYRSIKKHIFRSWVQTRLNLNVFRQANMHLHGLDGSRTLGITVMCQWFNGSLALNSLKKNNYFLFPL